MYKAALELKLRMCTLATREFFFFFQYYNSQNLVEQSQMFNWRVFVQHTVPNIMNTSVAYISSKANYHANEHANHVLHSPTSCVSHLPDQTYIILTPSWQSTKQIHIQVHFGGLLVFIYLFIWLEISTNYSTPKLPNEMCSCAAEQCKHFTLFHLRSQDPLKQN